MPVPERRRLGEYIRKGADAGLRRMDRAPEHRQAADLAAQRRATGQRATGPRVLMLSPRDWAYHSMVDGVIATALATRGADVRFLTCGGGFDVCDRANVTEAPPMPCSSCNRYVHNAVDAFGFERVDLIDPDAPIDPQGADARLLVHSVDELAAATYKGVPVGQLMQVPTRWFLLASKADMDPLHPMMLRQFLSTARRVVDGLERVLDEFRPDVMVMLSGLFSFESVALEMCRMRGVEAITYERTYRPDHLIFSRNAPASHYDITAAWERHRHDPLTPTEDGELDRYLATRRDDSHPIFDFWEGAEHAAPERRRSGKLAALFTNVTWDSAVIGRERAYGSIHDWIDATIELMAARPDDELVIRIHPAETKMSGKRTREPIEEYLERHHRSLPSNVAVIGPDTPLSSYPLMEAADVGLALTSIVGLELALLGKPVVVAGKPHYHDRGFTLDAASPERYAQLLNAALDAPSRHGADVDAARRYAHAFFFKVPIPFRHVTEPLPGLARLAVTGLRELYPGADSDLDRICDGILGSGDFGVAERAPAAPDASWSTAVHS